MKLNQKISICSIDLIEVYRNLVNKKGKINDKYMGLCYIFFSGRVYMFLSTNTSD